MNNNEIFEEFWKNYVWPEEIVPFWRLYYNKQTGEPIVYTMEDIPGDYIEITQDQYNLNSSNVFVKDSKIYYINLDVHVNKLIPSNAGEYSTHQHHVELLSSTEQAKQWTLKQLM
jgi:hypothetical protein